MTRRRPDPPAAPPRPLRPSHRIVAVPACLLVLALVALLPPVAAGAEDGGSWQWPLGQRRVVTTFDPPATRYAAGHRGLDLPGTPGEPVRAVAVGRVVFSGTVAGVGVVSIAHGDERSTYQPVVRRRVATGDAVSAGDVLGSLGPAGTHCVTACLHLGRVRGEEYLDPGERLGAEARFVLVDPEGPLPLPPAGALGDLTRPTSGPVTSAFGMRVHPVTGERKLHDGVDFGAPCGTPVRAAAAGTVVTSAHDGGYGLRVVIEHADGLRTGYAHLSSSAVSPGDRVDPRSQIGRVGTSGLSTGCHLHFMVERDGVPVDPMASGP